MFDIFKYKLTNGELILTPCYRHYWKDCCILQISIIVLLLAFLWPGATNYWHYVNIAKKTSGEKEGGYTWTNAAGVSWTLTFDESFEEGGKLTFM